MHRHHRQADLVDVGPLGLAVLRERGLQTLEGAGADREPVDRLRVTGGEAQRLVGTHAADHHRRPAAQRLGRVERAGELVVLAFERPLVVAAHLVVDGEGLVEALEPLRGRRVRHTERDVLLLEPGGADAERRPTTRQDVERRHGLGQQAGVAVRHAGHEELQIDPLGEPGSERQHRVALEHGVLGRAGDLDLEPVVHRRQRTEPGLVRDLGDLGDLRTDGGGAAVPGEVGE